MPFLRAFTDHPESVGETYSEHMAFAGRFGLRLMAAGAACVLHGVFPFLFKSSGSRCVRALYAELEACPARAALHRRAQEGAAAPAE